MLHLSYEKVYTYGMKGAIDMSLGERIKGIRLSKGMTRKELGAVMDLNCPDNRLEEYESGKKIPRHAMLSKIAKALCVSEEYLLTGKLDMKTLNGLKGTNYFNNDDLEYPEYYFQLIQLFSDNEALFSHCLDKNDLKDITKIVYDKVYNKRGNLLEIKSFISKEDYDEYMDYYAEQIELDKEWQQDYENEQLQNMIEDGIAYYDEQDDLTYNEQE